jgi:hypothetical protein
MGPRIPPPVNPGIRAAQDAAANAARQAGQNRPDTVLVDDESSEPAERGGPGTADPTGPASDDGPTTEVADLEAETRPPEAPPEREPIDYDVNEVTGLTDDEIRQVAERMGMSEEDFRDTVRRVRDPTLFPDLVSASWQAEEGGNDLPRLGRDRQAEQAAMDRELREARARGQLLIERNRVNTAFARTGERGTQAIIFVGGVAVAVYSTPLGIAWGMTNAAVSASTAPVSDHPAHAPGASALRQGLVIEAPAATVDMALEAIPDPRIKIPAKIINATVAYVAGNNLQEFVDTNVAANPARGQLRTGRDASPGVN